MRIAIDAVGIRGHGGAAVLCELLRWFPQVRPDWRWHVFLLKPEVREFSDPEVAPQITLEHTHKGDSGLGRLAWVYFHLPRRLRDIGPDVLFSFANIGASWPLVPQVVFCHQHNALCDPADCSLSLRTWARWRFMRYWILRGAQASAAVVVQTQYMRNRLLEIDASLSSRVHVIPSGYRSPSPAPLVRFQVRELIDGLSRPRLIYVTHPGEQKNHERLIQALSQITCAIPTARLLLTLEPPQRAPHAHYRQLVERMRWTAEREGVGKRVVFLGILTPDEVSFALRESDLMVFPSCAESFGLGLVEAMAAGCPIAASNLGYAHDVASRAAVYFDPYDPGSIAESVLALLHDLERLERLKEAACERSRIYSYQTIAEQFACLFTSAIQWRGAPRQVGLGSTEHRSK